MSVDSRENSSISPKYINGDDICGVVHGNSLALRRLSMGTNNEDKLGPQNDNGCLIAGSEQTAASIGRHDPTLSVVFW